MDNEFVFKIKIMQISFWEIIKIVLSVLWQLWPFWLIVLAFFIVRLFFDWLDLEIDNWHIRRKFREGESWRSDRDLLRWLRGMRPVEFEDYIADLFSRLGYKTRAVGQSHDGGVDVVAEKDGKTTYIQCKKFITSEVTVGAVRDFYGALADRLVNSKGYLITTNKFTLEAQRFAEDKPIELIDGFKLVHYIRMVKNNNKPDKELDDKIVKICPKCDGKLLERTGKFGVFYGCSNYPKCKYTIKK